MKKRAKKLICTVMAAIFLSLPFADLGAFAAAGGDTSADFSDPQSNANVTVAPSEMLKMLYEGHVSDSEAQYLDAYFEAAFIYCPEINAKNVTVQVSNGTVSVTASPRSYTAANGTVVTWYPVSATCADASALMIPSGNLYLCTLPRTDAETVTVKYECSIELPSEYVSAISEFAYNEATEGARIAHEHEQAISSYLDAITAYEKYLSDLATYENAVAAYSEYQERLAIYEKSLAEYNAYLSALATYNKELASYQKYLTEYEKYLSDKAAYEKAYAENQSEYEKYRDYLTNLSKIRASMAYMESLFVKPSNGVRELFEALQNESLVGMIEKYDDELVNFYGVKRSDIDTMRTVSDELNAILREYSEARDVSEEEAFRYYKANYRQITEKFKFLYDKMTAILTPTIYVHVCAWTELEYKHDPEYATYKKWRIRNVLCHIYLICRGLDDTVTADNTWTFYSDSGKERTYNFSELLGQNVILADTDAACPDGIEWWSGDIPNLELPQAPVRPAEIMPPVEPLPVKEPIAPSPVSAPEKAPAEVTLPQSRPKIENYDLVIRTAHYFGDTVPERHVHEGSRTVTFSHDVTRAFNSSGEPISAYYSHDGSLLSIGGEPIAPVRNNTPEYEYKFSGWTATVSDKDTLYYPKYTVMKRRYTVTFKHPDTGEVLYSIECEYGTDAEYGGAIPQKPQTNTTVYEFDGWYPTPSPIRQDTEYTAQFSESQRLYNVSFDILGDVQTRSLPYGAELVLPSVRDVQYVGGVKYRFVGWDNSAKTVTSDLSFTALFEKTTLVTVTDPAEGSPEIYDSGSSLMITANNARADISGLLKYAIELDREITLVTKDFSLRLDKTAVASLRTYRARYFTPLSSENGVGYAFADVAGDPVRFSGKAQMSIAHNMTDTGGIFICQDGANAVSCSVNGDVAEFLSKPSAYYKTDRYRSLNIAPAENGAVFADAHFYRAGDTVTLTVLPSSEYTVSRTTLTDAEGNTVDITGKTSFVMPDCNVTVSTEFLQKKYSVTFICDGEIFEVQEYALGEAIVAPEIPLSFEKDGFIYSFIGWSEPLTVVTSDATFTAKYSSIKIEHVEETETQTAVETVVKEQLIPAAAIFLAIVGAALGIVFTTVGIRKHSAKKNEKTKDTSGEDDDE